MAFLLLMFAYSFCLLLFYALHLYILPPFVSPCHTLHLSRGQRDVSPLKISFPLSLIRRGGLDAIDTNSQISESLQLVLIKTLAKRSRQRAVWSLPTVYPKSVLCRSWPKHNRHNPTVWYLTHTTFTTKSTLILDRTELWRFKLWWIWRFQESEWAHAKIDPLGTPANLFQAEVLVRYVSNTPVYYYDDGPVCIFPRCSSKYRMHRVDIWAKPP